MSKALAVVVLAVVALVSGWVGSTRTTTEVVEVTVTSTVGGTFVPAGLSCEEDEVIGFTGQDTLGCVHVDDLATGG